PGSLLAADEAIQALQRKVKAAVATARPAIACILVSRSTDYYKARYWGTPPPVDNPGQLGRFDAEAAKKKIPADVRNRKRLLAVMANHDLSQRSTVPESYGSGVILSDSLVLTNAHVVKNATKIYVRLPGGGRRGSWANIHASDPRSDLAVLKLLDPPADL